ncbi:siderophore ABC transporter substrate-binding protein [Celeribacter sp.]|uniref:siderophore ABC transporter substrate-binding protein n=1 Tax=Celeribacter sp. TaxID=1890673 RepID=UPI003A91D1F9
MTFSIPKIALAATLFFTPVLTVEAADFPLTLTDQMGEITLQQVPERVVALGMNDLDFLDSLGVPVAGIPKDFVPNFLSAYGDDPAVKDVGFIVKPNVEKLYEAEPDLVLMSPLQAEHYADISSFAPVVYFEVDYRDSSKGHLAAVRDHFETLGKVFDKEDVARAGIEELDGQVSALNAQMSGCSDKALILLHNNGAFSSFGQQSRYGFVFNELGVKPAGAVGETGLHGQPVTSEFIQKSNPDLIFMIDRTAVMEGRPTLTKDQIANPLVEATKAWQDDRVIFVDPEAWYTTAAGPTSLSIMMKEIGAAYDHVGACSQTDGNAKF